MALICMAVHDTEENGRTALTKRTIDSLLETIDFKKHRLIISDNNSCQATKEAIRDVRLSGIVSIFTVPENVGTSRAINLAWRTRQPGEHAIKIDNDVVIHSSTWVDEMEEAIERDPRIGIIGLKRKDLIQSPDHPDPNYRSEFVSLPHQPGQRWITVERTPDIIGTCTMFNSALLDKVGYSYQPGLYGYEDVLFCHRSHIAGFYNCFLPHIEIDHIDPGQPQYQAWKERHSGEHTKQMIEQFKKYQRDPKSIYHEFY